MNRVVYRKDMVDCVLCLDPPCSKACPCMDPGSILRSVWFDNEKGAKLQMKEDCPSCPALCEKACMKSVPIKKVMEKVKRVTVSDVDISDEKLLESDICGIKIENPFLLSSSVVGSTYEMCARAFDEGWAGVAFKTLSLMDIHEASPRFSAIKGDTGSIIGFKNIEQLSDHTLEENLDIFRRLKENYPNKFLLASIMGRDEEEWEYLSRKVTEAGADAIELNFSCPNMVEDGTGSDVGQSPRVVELFTKAARRGTNLPILSKLTPNVGIMSPAAEASVRGGADGIAAINTIKSLIEIEPGSGKVAVGGFSGNSVRPIAMRFISELSQNKALEGKHISAMGGIETWKDALAFILLGAKSIQITTAVMQYGYRIIDDLKKGLLIFMKERGVTMDDIVGGMVKKVVDVEEVERDIVVYPKFLREKCIGCGRCVISCMDGGHQAISFTPDRKPLMDPKKCVGCHLCILVCPEEAIVSSGKVIRIKE